MVPNEANVSARKPIPIATVRAAVSDACHDDGWRTSISIEEPSGSSTVVGTSSTVPGSSRYSGTACRAVPGV